VPEDNRFGTVYTSTDGNVSAWICDKRTIRIQSEDHLVVARIRRWKGSREVVAGVNCFMRVFEMRRRKMRWAFKKLGLPLPAKNPRRIEQGRKLAQRKRHEPHTCNAEDRADRSIKSNMKESSQ
jgi:hypothetical protein